MRSASQLDRNPLRDAAHGDGRSGGQAVVEFTVILPVMLMLLVMALDFGRLFYSYVGVHNAAREATFVAATSAADSSYDQDEFIASVTAAALRESGGQSQFGAGTVDVSAPTCFVPGSDATIDCHQASQFASGSGNRVSVSVSQQFDFITPFVNEVFGGSLVLSASATGPVLNPPYANVVAPEPSATPTPSPTATPSPTPTPTPGPTCTVPDLYHWYWDEGVLLTWQLAGFSGTLTDETDGKKIKTQTLTAGADVACSSDMTVDDH